MVLGQPSFNGLGHSTVTQLYQSKLMVWYLNPFTLWGPPGRDVLFHQPFSSLNLWRKKLQVYILGRYDFKVNLFADDLLLTLSQPHHSVPQVMKLCNGHLCPSPRAVLDVWARLSLHLQNTTLIGLLSAAAVNTWVMGVVLVRILRCSLCLQFS